MIKIAVLILLLALSSVTLAHPGESEEHHQSEARAIQAAHSYFKRSAAAYSTCSSSARKRSWNNALAERRALEIAELRARVSARKASLARRQSNDTLPSMPEGGNMTSGGPDGNGTFGGGGAGAGTASFDSYGETLLNTSHASSRTDITANSTSAAVFNSSSENTTCLLQPEVTIGPYWVAGEYVRADMSEDQAGLPIYMSTQVIDVATCEPVSGLYWEMWHANASGVYSGVVASGNGDSTEESNINSTFCRGMQPTDEMGVATIQSVFPGHYTGRATHVHVIGHANATVYANGTIGTGSSGDGDSVALHIGQLFFDQDLLTAVAGVSPYSENTQTVTDNAADSVLAQSAVNGSSDPIFEYVYLGDTVEDGVYAWVTVGINTNETRATQAASYLDAEGGHEGTDSLDIGGAGGGVEPTSDSSASAAIETATDLLVAASTSSSIPAASSTANAASQDLPRCGAAVKRALERIAVGVV